MSIKEILFPRQVGPVRLAGFRLFNMGGRARWLKARAKRLWGSLKR